MSWFKSSVIISFLLLSLFTHPFDDMTCLDSRFDISVSHKGNPLGLIERRLSIKKEACEIEVALKYNFFMKKVWVVDVCREPVHVKFNNQFNSRDVLRKNSICPKVNEPFCNSIIDLQKVIQNNGLVYAEGEKEQLSKDHGKAYCSYLLIKKYTDNGFIFSREKEYSNILIPKDEVNIIDQEKEAPGSGNF